MNTSKCHCCSGCGTGIGRRGFLAAAGATTLALQLESLDWASSLFAAESKPAESPVVHVVVTRPRKTPIVSWPGGQTDVAAQQALFLKTIREAAAKLGVRVVVRDEPLENCQAIDQFLEQFKQTKSDGLLVCAMELTLWPEVQHLVSHRGEVPCIVYSNMTAFTGYLRATRAVPRTFVGATPEVTWLAYAVRMFHTCWKMKNTRIAILQGDQMKDAVVKNLGTQLRYLPARRFDEELSKVEATAEVKAMAEQYAKNAQEIIEPKPAEILDAAKNYIVCRRIMEAEQCQGISFACLGRVNPVCVSFSRLIDEGVPAGCEADVDAVLSLQLTLSLFNKPGFIQDPSANTVRNTLIGAHCTSATRLEGLDKPYRAPYKLRSYHTGTGAALQVLWPVGKDVTVMRLSGPESMILGSGKVVGNIAQPPSGCCRTAVEISLDGVADTDDCKGFHQLFVLGKLENDFRAYCHLAGIKPVHI